MVRNVAGDDVSQRPHGNGIITRDSRPIPRLIRQTLEERDRGEADVFELLDEVSPRSVVCLSGLDGDVLVETRQRVGKPTRKPDRPARKDALAIVNVVQHLANSPLSGRVRMETLLLADPAQKLEHLVHLVLECGDDVVAGDKVDVREIVVCGFGRMWSCHLAENPNKNR